MLGNLFTFPGQNLYETSGILIIILIVWSIVWKGFALWKSARNNQKYWFLALLVLNTVGIAEIIYLAFFQKKASSSKTSK